jgi:hypothetical protein
MVVGECALKSPVSKMKGTRCGVGSLGKRKVVGRLFGSAPRAWRVVRQAAAYGAAAWAGAVAARALSDEGDDPGLTDRVGPPVSEREATADWAGQGGRRWAAAGLENKGGGRAETISRTEIK